MRFVAEKTDGGKRKGRISLYCRVLEISRQGFYRYLARQGRPWKYQGLAEAMRAIHKEDPPMAAGGCARRCCWPGPKGSVSPAKGLSAG